jgi:hypothetical protein
MTLEKPGCLTRNGANIQIHQAYGHDIPANPISIHLGPQAAGKTQCGDQQAFKEDLLNRSTLQEKHQMLSSETC